MCINEVILFICSFAVTSVDEPRTIWRQHNGERTTVNDHVFNTFGDTHLKSDPIAAY